MPDVAYTLYIFSTLYFFSTWKFIAYKDLLSFFLSLLGVNSNKG